MKKVIIIVSFCITTFANAQVITVNGLLFPSGTIAATSTADELLIGGPSSDFATIKFPLPSVSTCYPNFERKSIADDIENYGKAILVVVTASDCPYCMDAATAANTAIMRNRNNITIWFVDKKLYTAGSCADIDFLKGRFPFLNEAKFSFVDVPWNDSNLPGSRTHHNPANSAFWTMPDMPSVYRVIDPITKKVTKLGYGFDGETELLAAIAKNFDPNPNLKVSPSKITFFKQGNAATLSVSSSIAWKVYNPNDWITISTTSGNGNLEFEAIATPNTTTSARIGIISFSGVGNKNIIAITQSGTTGTMSIDQNSFLFDNNKNTGTVSITGNVNWEAKEKLDWISISKPTGKGNGTFTFTANPNFIALNKIGIITLLGDGFTIPITITQTGSALEFSVETNEITLTGTNSLEYYIDCNANWSIVGIPSWLFVDPPSGIETPPIIFTASQNNTGLERVAYLTIVGFNTNYIPLRVTQSASTTQIKMPTDYKNQSLVISPNPIESNGILKLSHLTDAKIYTSIGECIKKVENTKEMDLVGIKPGIYILQTNHSKTFKLIIK